MTFDEAFVELLGHEGGYSNNPLDPGGETMWGVTAKVARANGYDGPMKDLPVEFAKKLYKKSYWDPVWAEQLPRAVRYAVFDAAVNSGPVQAIKWLQEAAKTTVDGKLGPNTMKAIQACDTEYLEARFLGIRLMFMSNLNHWNSFSRGWSKRIAKLLMEW